MATKVILLMITKFLILQLGQALSTRPDIVPPVYCQELAKLQVYCLPSCGWSICALSQWYSPVEHTIVCRFYI